MRSSRASSVDVVCRSLDRGGGKNSSVPEAAWYPWPITIEPVAGSVHGGFGRLVALGAVAGAVSAVVLAAGAGAGRPGEARAVAWRFTVANGVSTTRYLGDLRWALASNGLGPVERNMSVGGQAPRDGKPITLHGVTYPKGLGIHAVADVTKFTEIEAMR